MKKLTGKKWRKPNPMARDLMQPKYRQRVVEDKTKYNRKVKHRKKDMT